MSLIKTLNDIKGKFLPNLPTVINERFARERYDIRRKGIEYNFFSIPCAITNSFYTLVGLVLREISSVLFSTKFCIGGEEKREKIVQSTMKNFQSKVKNFQPNQFSWLCAEDKKYTINNVWRIIVPSFLFNFTMKLKKVSMSMQRQNPNCI